MNGGVSYYYHYGVAFRTVGPVSSAYYYTTYYPYTAYDNAPNSATVANYFINIYNSILGTFSINATSSALTALPNALKVILTYNQNVGYPNVLATAYSDNSFNTSVGSITSQTTSLGKMHGIIIVPSTNQGNTIGQFDAYVTG
jgi:hypothetical protein